MTDDQFVMTVTNDPAQLRLVEEQVDAFGQRNDLPSKSLFSIKLALSELLANTITYGYADKATHTIEIRLELRGRRLNLEIIDDARPFDPRGAKPPKKVDALKDLPLGGRGIYLVRNFVDDLGYQRKGGRNHVTVTKTV
jgi:anti-sigma regulatory factor (Ser/Thr protein kinase)